MQSEHSHPFATAFFGSGPVDYSAAVHSRAGAILWLGYPGQSGGAALAAVLTGAASPAGRLVTTVYPAAYAQQVSMLDMSFRPSSSNPGRTYRFYPAESAVFEFGFGMSYTKFVFDWLQGDESGAQMSDAQSAADDSAPVESLSIRQLHSAHRLGRRSAAVSWRVNVTNAGMMASDCVVLLFLTPSATAAAPDPSAPLKQLIGFDRIAALQPSETRQVFFGVQARQLALVNERGERWLQPGRYRLGLDVPTRQWREIELTGLAMQLH